MGFLKFNIEYKALAFIGFVFCLRKIDNLQLNDCRTDEVILIIITEGNTQSNVL